MAFNVTGTAVLPMFYCELHEIFQQWLDCTNASGFLWKHKTEHLSLSCSKNKIEITTPR